MQTATHWSSFLGSYDGKIFLAQLSALAVLSSPGEQAMRLTATAGMANHLNTAIPCDEGYLREESESRGPKCLGVRAS
jgi:hypothetical protein